MRIVGGRFRGRVLAAPKSQSIRPTTDRARETLFNMLGARISLDGLRVIDLFAGTGALGLEALSRGAAFAMFVENSAEGARLIRTNIDAHGVAGATHLMRRPVEKLGNCNAERFDLVFADPPYGRELVATAADVLARGNWLEKGAMLVAEETPDNPPGIIAGFKRIETRRVGQSLFTFYRFEGDLAVPVDHAKMTKD